MDVKYAVLIVDDDHSLLKMASELLRDDYAVSCVKSGVEALELLKTDYMPDVILLDVDMPELDGFATLARLREQDITRDVPVVFLTGAEQTEYQLRGLSSGAVDYVTKPFVKELLLARLKIHIENGKRLRELCAIQKGKPEHSINEEKFERLAEGLTDTEKKVLRLIILGYTNQEIAESLSYSYNYIKKVANAIYDKKRVNRRSELKKLVL